MYHEHPLRILRYSAKNIWLLIFPLLRGINAFTLDVNKFYSWVRGAWFDIAVLGAILMFGLIRWYFSRITITDEAIVHVDGVFARIRTTIPYNKLSSVTIEHSFYLRPFGGMRISCDTPAGIFKSNDMKLMVNKKVCAEIIKNIPDINVKNGVSYHHKPTLISVLLFSVFFSSSFSGAVYVAAFFFKGGDIAKDLISVSIDRITEETSRISKMLIINIPVAAVGIGSFFLATWFLSFLLNMIRYSGFYIKSDARQIEVVCGTVTRRRYRINSQQINYTDLRQNLIMKLFKAVTVNISCAGYGSSNNQLPVLLPIKKANSLSTGLEKLGVCSGDKKVFRPKMTSFWQYIWQPVITAAAVYPTLKLLTNYFPRSLEFASFIMIMIDIPAIWLICVKITAVATSGISVYESKIMIRYSKGYDFHTVVAEKERLVKISAGQTPFQKLFKKCTLSFYFNGEQTQRHFVKAIKVSDAEQIAILLGFEHFECGRSVSSLRANK